VTKRNFQELSPYDFEILAAELLEAEWGGTVETFPQGADGGIDVRLLSASNGKPKYAQCKHSPGKSWAGISSGVKREAANNATRDLREYWFVTSARLSMRAKEKIAALFSSQELKQEHILGVSDIDKRLDENSDIERRNIKLYLSSVAVLQAVLNNAAYVRQQQYFDAILERRKFFVGSKALPIVRKVLGEHRMCIVSGEPGVGKTTLCETVALQLMEEGYETFDIKNISEAQDVWRKDSKQLFIYDDFLGQTSLSEKLGRLEDQELEKFALSLRRSDRHLLLLSTREYILEAASKTYPRLDSAAFQIGKVVVDVGSYTDFQRAHILYNHVHFSDLKAAARASLIANRKYDRVLDHVNYNPRLIAMIILEAAAKGGVVAGRGFADFLLAGLDDPSRLWESILTSELGDTARDVLLTLCSLPTLVSEQTLFLAASSFCQTEGSVLTTSEFSKALKVLGKVFVTIGRNGSSPMIELRNPGVRDFLTGHILKDQFVLERLHRAVIAPDQVQRMYSWAVTSSFGGASPAWRSLSGEQKSHVFELNQKSATRMVALLACNAVGLSRVYASASDEFAVQWSGFEDLVLLLCNAADEDGNSSVLASLNNVLWPVCLSRWTQSPYSPAKIAKIWEIAHRGMSSEQEAELVASIVELLEDDSSGYVDLESHVAIVQILEASGSQHHANEVRASCEAAIDEEFEGLWSFDDAGTITYKIEEINLAIRALNLSDRWETERETHEGRGEREEVSPGPPDLSRIELADQVSGAASIADLFKTWKS